MKAVTRTADPTEQNQILHFCLKEKCTTEALKIVCDVFTKVKGNPKMRALGEDMRQKLETGVCVCVCVYVECVYVCMRVSVYVCMRVCMCVCMYCFCDLPSSTCTHRPPLLRPTRRSVIPQLTGGV